MEAFMLDKQGREYAKMNDLRAGDFIEVDGDFSCLEKGARRQVCAGCNYLFIICDSGTHHLDGQLVEDGSLLGIYKV
jgi:hypothetical protein